MRVHSLVAAAILVGCVPEDQFQYAGTPVWQMFPFDGQRSWEYVSTDPELPHWLTAQIVGSESKKATNVYSLEFGHFCVSNDPDCVDGPIRTIKMSSDAIDGVQIHGWAEGDTDFTYSPPIVLAETEMEVGDVLESQTGGTTWTSSLVSFEDCPLHMNVAEAWSCGRFRLTDADSDPLTGSGLAGDYWAIESTGLTGIELEIDSGQWRMATSDYDCESPCDPGQW